MQRAVAVSGIEPPPVGDNASRAGGSANYGRASLVEHQPRKWFIQASGPHECQVDGVDDIDAPGPAIRQIVFIALRIEKADVERLQWTAERNGRQTLSLRVRRRPRTGAGSRHGNAGSRERYQPEQRWREHA